MVSSLVLHSGHGAQVGLQVVFLLLQVPEYLPVGGCRVVRRPSGRSKSFNISLCSQLSNLPVMYVTYIYQFVSPLSSKQDGSLVSVLSPVPLHHAVLTTKAGQKGFCALQLHILPTLLLLLPLGHADGGDGESTCGVGIVLVLILIFFRRRCSSAMDLNNYYIF